MGMPVERQGLSIQSWQELTNHHFLSLHCEALNPASFQCSMLVRPFAQSVAAELAVGASRVVRSRHQAAAAERGHFKVLWQLSGVSRVSQGAHTGQLEPGMWSVYDTIRPYTLESSERARFLTLLMPQQESFGWGPGVAALAGRALDGRGAARIVLASVATLLREDTALDNDSQATLQDATVALIEQALSREARGHALPLDQPASQRLAHIQAWIGHHLQDPQLSPEQVAQAFQLSRRTLYNLFVAARTTPRAYIQQCRLTRASQWLRDPACQTLPVVQIAQRCGFASAAHFTRSFTAQYGLPPAQWRQLPPG